MNKPLLVWLHGFCFDHNRDTEFVNKLRDALGANLLNIDAPHIGSRPRGGYMWHDVPIKHRAGITREFVSECTRQLKVSADHIRKTVEAELERLGLSWGDVIVAGHSQGADMAVRFILQHQPVKYALSFCGADPEYTIQKNIKFKTTPIIWVAGIGDIILPQEYRNCWIVYRDAGVPVEYMETECRDNGHDYPHDTIIPKVVEAIK